jgi:dihydrofolate reductase
MGNGKGGTMGKSKVKVEISMSLDGYVAGPNPSLEDPLGRRGEELHEWIFGLDAWRQAHGHGEGDRGADNEIVEEQLASQGAVIMGRKMFSGGSGPWEDDPNADGWWGEEPPFRVPVFVLTHHARPAETKGDTEITFVTEGIGAALDLAREAAGELDVVVAGGAEAIQQAIATGQVEELNVHVAPVLLGGGTRLFAEGVAPKLELVRTVASPGVTHFRYRVA